MKGKPGAIDVQVGAKIRLRRRTVGLSQTAVAQGLGITFQQFQKYETGKNRIGAGRLSTVAEILGVPVEFFFRDPEAVDVDSKAGDGQTDELMAFVSQGEGLTLNAAFNRIPNLEKRKRIADLVSAIAEADGDNGS